MIHNIQVLRFLAAFLILMNHLLQEVVVLELAPEPRFAPIPWAMGVDIFFIISGFIIYYVAGEDFGRSGAAGKFLRRRLARVVPPYWLFTTLMIGIGVLAGQAFPFASARIATSYAFLPWPRPDGGMFPILSLGWTLNYEIFFYAAFAMALLHRRGLWFLVGAFLLLAASHSFVPDKLFLLRFWTDPIILEFVLGIGLAKLYLRGVRISWWLGVFLIVAGLLASRLDLAPLRPLLLGLPALLICAGFALSRSLEGLWASRGLRLGGDASYALYLSHPFSIGLLSLLWSRAGGGLWLFLAAGILFSLAAAILIHLYVERPMIGFFQRRRTHEPLELGT